VITLHLRRLGGRDCYQAVLSRPTGETIKSPLFLQRGEVIRWIMGVLAQSTSPSPSPSKAGA
jgi:hypothetical protein